MANKNWTRDQHILAFNLYNKIPFGQMHKGNPEVISLAQLIGRTPSAVGMKLGNFARLDPALQSRGIKGLPNGAKGEVEIWEEFNSNPEELAFESQKLLAETQNKTLESVCGISTSDLPKSGTEREVLIKQRVNQSFFRDRILSIYENKCCITGLAIPQLLVAGHIIPWSVDTSNRLNPNNGLCLNMIHDKAFDRGLMWIDSTYTIRYTDTFKEVQKENSKAYDWLKSYDGRQLILPRDFTPSIEFLEAHKHGIWRATFDELS